MSGCLVSDVHADEEAKYGSPGLVWLHMVCWLVDVRITSQKCEMMIILEITKATALADIPATLAALSVKPCGKTAHFEIGLFIVTILHACGTIMLHFNMPHLLLSNKDLTELECIYCPMLLKS